MHVKHPSQHSAHSGATVRALGGGYVTASRGSLPRDMCHRSCLGQQKRSAWRPPVPGFQAHRKRVTNYEAGHLASSPDTAPPLTLERSTWYLRPSSSKDSLWSSWGGKSSYSGAGGWALRLECVGGQRGTGLMQGAREGWHGFSKRARLGTPLPRPAGQAVALTMATSFFSSSSSFSFCFFLPPPFSAVVAAGEYSRPACGGRARGVREAGDRSLYSHRTGPEGRHWAGAGGCKGSDGPRGRKGGGRRGPQALSLQTSRRVMGSMLEFQGRPKGSGLRTQDPTLGSLQLGFC